MPKLPIGTIVKLTDTIRENVWAIVVDPGYNFHGDIEGVKRLSQKHDGFTRVLEPSHSRLGAMKRNGGWWIDQYTYTYEIIPEEEIPEEIIVLAMRCLLDRSFVPFVSEDYKV